MAKRLISGKTKSDFTKWFAGGFGVIVGTAIIFGLVGKLSMLKIGYPLQTFQFNPLIGMLATPERDYV